MAAREENILNVPLSETLEGMHVLCDTGDTGEPYRVAASLFIAEATQAAKDAVSNLDPKDVILKGFTALTAGKPAITANSTLLAAIQSLYAMVGSGKVKIVSDGADQTGMVCWNGASASGFVINVNEAAIYTRSQWTQSNPDSVTDANWIAAVKTGGTKNPFNALNTLLTGWMNRTTQKPTITSANTIFDALKALYWASGNGNVLNISNGENRFGFVGWNANTAYGFMVDTANFTIYIRQWAQAQATSNANTTALWREAIQGGEAYSLKHPLNVYNYSGSGNIPSGDLAKVGAAEVFVYEIGGQRAPLFKVTGDDTVTQFSSAPIVESGDPSSGEPLKIHYMSVEVNLRTGTVKTDIVPISGSGGTSNVIHGEDITEGLEYLIPDNVGDVVAFRSTMDSAQVPAEQEGFGFLAKVNRSESMAMMMQNDPAGGGKMKFFMGRVQNDGSGTDWQELTTGSSTGTALPLSRVEINDFGDYDTLYAILNQTGDMVAIFANYPDSGPSSNGGAYVGTAQLDKDYSDAIIYDVYNVHTNTRYRGSVSSADHVVWTGAHRDVAKTISVSDFTSEALFASPYNFHLYPSGTMIPIEGTQQAEQGPFPESRYKTAGYIMVQYGDNHLDSAIRQVMVVLHEVGTIAERPGRMAYATISNDGLNPLWQMIGDSRWLWTGDKALTDNTTASLLLDDYTRRTGDRLEIYYAYLGGATAGRIMGFNNAVSVLYNPAETLTQSFFALITSKGSVSLLEAQFEFRMSGSNLQITGRDLNTGGVNVVSQFRIKGVRLVR